jgi:hypothetical protein
MDLKDRGNEESKAVSLFAPYIFRDDAAVTYLFEPHFARDRIYFLLPFLSYCNNDHGVTT